MDAVSSAAQFFSAPASGGTVSGAASLFGNGGGLPMDAGTGQLPGQAAEVVATFENLLAALINGDGASVQNALNTAVVDGAVTLDDGKLALGPALQRIGPAELASGKPALDQLIADGQAAPAAALLAMLLNGDGDAPSSKIAIASENVPSDPVQDLAGPLQVQAAAPADADAPGKGAKPIAASPVGFAGLQGLLLSEANKSSGDASPAPLPTEAAHADDAESALALPRADIADASDAATNIDAGVDDEDAKAVRERAALDLMAALLAQQPTAPPPVAPKPELALAIETVAAAPAQPAPPTELPAVPMATAPHPTGATPAPEMEADFARELAPPQADTLAPKHLVAARAEQATHASAPEKFTPQATRPFNDGAPAAPQPATTSTNAVASTSSSSVADASDANGSNLNRDGQQQSDNSQRQPTEIDMLRSGAVPSESGRTVGHQDFASQLANASRGSHGGGASSQMPAFQQVAVQIRRAVIDGEDHLKIQLKPAELGRIDVRLQFSGDGRVSAHITADNVATLDLMQRDTRGLERALQDAGLQTDSGSLSFNLRGDNRQGTDQQDNRGASGNARFTLDGPVEPEPEELPAGRWVPAGRIDVRV